MKRIRSIKLEKIEILKYNYVVFSDQENCDPGRHRGSEPQRHEELMDDL